MFQVKQNWLTWNTDRPQRALKQGLVFQVNVRNRSTVRNGKEMAFFVTLRAKNDVFLLFLCSQWGGNSCFVPVAHKKQLFLRADSKRVAQCICFREPLEGGWLRNSLDFYTSGAANVAWSKVQWGRVRHRLAEWTIPMANSSCIDYLKFMHNYFLSTGFIG